MGQRTISGHVDMFPISGPACTGFRRTLLCILFLLGLCSCLRQYIFVNQQMSWLEAQTYCRNKYTDLATMDSMEDVTQLVAAAGGFSGTVWVGLYDRSWEWNWSAPTGFQPLSYIGNWNNNPPYYSRVLWELCVAQTDNNWFEYYCNISQPFVCYTNLPLSSKTYTYVSEAKTWYEAQAYCRQNYTDLANELVPKDEDDVHKVIPDHITAFIGLYRPTWKWWSDGTVHTFENWVEGCPQSRTGDCAASLIDPANVGKLREYDCNTNFFFMCYGPPPEPAQIKYIKHIKLTALKSTADLNDPAVTSAILTQMEQKLRETGITASLNITWITQPDEKIFHEENN